MYKISHRQQTVGTYKKELHTRAVQQPTRTPLVCDVKPRDKTRTRTLSATGIWPSSDARLCVRLCGCSFSLFPSNYQSSIAEMVGWWGRARKNVITRGRKKAAKRGNETRRKGSIHSRTIRIPIYSTILVSAWRLQKPCTLSARDII